MASYQSADLLNLAANDLTNRTLSVRLHDGAPGNAGTGNRIGAISVDIAAGGWTDAVAGAVVTSADTSFGVLSSSGRTDVDAYSVWSGNDFLWWADVYQTGTTTVGVRVPSNFEFTISAGEIGLTFS